MSSHHCPDPEVSANAGEELDNIEGPVPVFVVDQGQRVQVPSLPEVTLMIVEYARQVCLEPNNVSV